MSKLSVHLVAWNGAKYIPYLFESLRKQTYKDWELLAVDNHSTKDNTADLIAQELKNFPVPARLIRNKENNGFAGGHNQAVRIACRSERAQRVEGSPTNVGDAHTREILRSAQNDELPEYIQLLNQDMYLAPDYFEKVVKMMDEKENCGAGQGLLLRWDFSRVNSQSSLVNSLSDVIDTMGLKVMRNRRVVDFRTGETFQPVISNAVRNLTPSKGQGEEIPRFARNDVRGGIEVFGVSGALPIYRCRAIEDVLYEGKMFDEDFFSYKEDVDLAFRLRSAEWKAYVESEARAWHDRTAAGPRQMSDRAAHFNRKTKAAYVNYYSYRNHLVVLLKNEPRANLAKDWPAMVWYEFKKFAYLLFTDLATLKGLRDIKHMWPRIKQKRTAIMANYKVKPEEMRKWYV